MIHYLYCKQMKESSCCSVAAAERNRDVSDPGDLDRRVFETICCCSEKMLKLQLMVMHIFSLLGRNTEPRRLKRYSNVLFC